MKKNILMIIGAILFLSLVVVLGMGPKVFYYKVLYHGEREKFVVSIFVDDRKLDITKDSVNIIGKSIDNNNKEKSVNLGKVNKMITDKLDLSFDGSHFGTYNLKLKAEEYDVDINFIRYNWWYVDKYNIEIYIDTKTQIIKYKVESQRMDNKANITDENYEASTELKDKNVNLYLM